MRNDLERQIAGLQQNDHLCLIYESSAEHMAAVVPYIREGLARDERCIYMADNDTAEAVGQALRASGVGVARDEARGALSLLTTRFAPEELMAFLRRAIDGALGCGFSGLRAAVEMTWALGPDADTDRLIECEASMNALYAHSRALGLCQYNRHRAPARIIRDVLRTHLTAILADRVYPNLFYERPESILGDESPEDRVKWMIAQLQRAHGLEEAVAMDRARLEAALAVTRERVQLAGELHETLSQLLFSAALALDWCLRQVPDTSALSVKLEEVRREIGLMMAHVRELIAHLSPEAPPGGTFAERLRTLMEQVRSLTGTAVDFTERGDLAQLGLPQQEILQETLEQGLATMVKHAQAARVAIRLDVGADTVAFDVTGAGAGLPAGVDAVAPIDALRQLGLDHMRARIEAIGGRLMLSGSHPTGFRLSGTLPLR